MAQMDEFQEERDAVIKYGTPKEKLSYFWDYYKWHTIITILIITLLFSYIYTLVTAKDSVLNGCFLNIYEHEDSDYTTTDLANEFIAKLQLDASEYEVAFDTNLSYAPDGNATSESANYTVLQALMARAAGGDIDFIVGPHRVMNRLAYQEFFIDLSEVLTEEQYALYEPYFLYMDMAVIEQLDAAIANGEDGSAIAIPDCTKPETMAKPVPIFIDFSQNEKLTTIYGATNNNLTFGIVGSASNLDNSLKFIEFLNTD